MKYGDNITTNRKIMIVVVIAIITIIVMAVSACIGWYVYPTDKTITIAYDDGAYSIKYEMFNALNCRIISMESYEWCGSYPEEFYIPAAAPNGAKVREIAEDAFEFGVSYVKKLYIPDTVEQIHPRAFGTMDMLEYLYIGNRVESSLTRCFSGCFNLSEIKTHDNPYYSTPDSLCLVENETWTLVLGTVSGYVPDGIRCIGASAFSHRNVTEVSFPETLTSIGEYAFYRCYSLVQDITLPASVVSIGEGAFSWSAITSLEGGSYTEIPRSMLNACNNLTEFDISPHITHIGVWGISSHNLRYLYIPASVESMDKEAVLASLNAVICCEDSAKPSGWNTEWLLAHKELRWDISKSQRSSLEKQILESWQGETYEFEQFICVLEKARMRKFEKGESES